MTQTRDLGHQHRQRILLVLPTPLQEHRSRTGNHKADLPPSLYLPTIFPEAKAVFLLPLFLQCPPSLQRGSLQGWRKRGCFAAM